MRRALLCATRCAVRWLVSIGALTCLAPAALAHGIATPPAVGFDAHPGAWLPDVRLVDEAGQPVAMSSLTSARPSLLAFGYYGCTDLCGVLLRGTKDAIARAGQHAGSDVEVIVVSIDPDDTPALARARRAAVLGGADAGGWHFLTAKAGSIAALAAAVGFDYARASGDGGRDEKGFAHAAGLVVIAPGGRVAQYLAGVSFEPDVLTSAIAQAARNEVAPASALRWLRCFHYDPQTGRYTPIAMNLARVAALAGALILGFLGWSRRGGAAR